MDFLLFEGDDLDLMHQAINKLQLCFHPTYAPMGHFSAHDLFDMQDDEKRIITLSVIGVNHDGTMSRVLFNAKTGEVIA